MSCLTLSSDRALARNSECKALLREFNLERPTMASDDIANKFVSEALNDLDGERFIDVRHAFPKVRRALGSSLTRTIHNREVTPALLHRMADRIRHELSSFMHGRGAHGVLVYTRTQAGNALELIQATGRNTQPSRIAKGSAIIIPTGVISPCISNDDVYLRVDVERSRDRRSRFAAEEFLFCDRHGNSIAGFADARCFVENIDDVPDALKKALGAGYDVTACNAAIFNSWWSHCQLNPLGDIIRIPLPPSITSTSAFALVMRRTGSNSWEVLLEENGEVKPLAWFLPDAELNVDVDALKDEHRNLMSALRAAADNGFDFDSDHIFDERIDRFPAEFIDECCENPEDAVRRFTDEIKRGLAMPERWLPSLFHSGHEYELFLNGDSANTRLQMLLPLALTDEDVANGTSSVYAVLEAWQLPGEDVCVVGIPTILTPEQAKANRNAFRRMLRRAYRKCA